MIVIHHLNVSQSERIIWLCEELALPYELKIYPRTKLKSAPKDYQALHPMGIAPVVEIDGVMLAESGAIVEYISRKLAGGRLTPAPDEPCFAEWAFWFHLANGTVMPSEMMSMIFRLLPPLWPLRKAMRYRSNRAFRMMDEHLAAVPWLAGQEFTTAEIMMAFPFTTMRHFSKIKLAEYPNIRGWLKRIGARPAYQRAMAKGDPGMTLLLN